MIYSKYGSVKQAGNFKEAIFSYQLCQMSRSVPSVLQRKPRQVEVGQPVLPPLINSVQNRLTKLKQTVDLGLGPVSNDSTDVLEEAFIKALTVDQVKVLIRANFRSMSPAHISTCFETINNIVKYSGDQGDVLKFDLLGSKEVFIFI